MKNVSSLDSWGEWNWMWFYEMFDDASCKSKLVQTLCQSLAEIHVTIHCFKSAKGGYINEIYWKKMTHIYLIDSPLPRYTANSSTPSSEHTVESTSKQIAATFAKSIMQAYAIENNLGYCKKYIDVKLLFRYISISSFRLKLKLNFDELDEIERQ